MLIGLCLFPSTPEGSGYKVGGRRRRPGVVYVSAGTLCSAESLFISQRDRLICGLYLSQWMIGQCEAFSA